MNNDINDNSTSIECNNLNILHNDTRFYKKNINDFQCLLNNSVKCLHKIIPSKIWNTIGFIPQKTNGFSSYKNSENLNQNDRVSIHIKRVFAISVEQSDIISEACCIK